MLEIELGELGLAEVWLVGKPQRDRPGYERDGERSVMVMTCVDIDFVDVDDDDDDANVIIIIITIGVITLWLKLVTTVFID